MNLFVRCISGILVMLSCINLTAISNTTAKSDALESVPAALCNETEKAPAETKPIVTAEETAPVETFAEAREDDQIPLYFQTDYPNNRYGSGTIATTGCGITSLAMVATRLTKHVYLPDELAEYFGGYGENNIQRLEYASDMLQLPWKKAKNFHDVVAALKEGNIAIALMNAKSIFTESQHFIVLEGMTENGKIMVKDPYAPNYDKWDLKNAFETGFDEGDVICGFSGGWIYDASAMPDEPFIYVEEKPYVETRYPDLKLTREEQELLAKVIWVEARGESKEGQQAIAEVVFNRMISDEFPDTLRSVIYAEGQFRSVDHLEDAKPVQAQYDAIDDALEGPYMLPIEVVHFATYPVNENVWGEIGGHVFCYQS